MISVRPLLVLAVTAAFTTGCGAEVQESAHASTGAAVTVTNCGVPLTVDGVPDRVVTNDTGITEMMFALGLADHLAGYTTYPGKERDIASSPWRADFERTPELGEAFTKEVVQAAAPDFVFAGWSYGFKDTTGLTPEWVRSIGADPYLLTESCRQPGTHRRGVMKPFDALYTDLANLGEIFGVQDKAEELIAEYREQVDNADEGAPQEPARVFLFDSASPEPFTSGRRAAPSQIIREAGGANIFDDIDDSWTSTSWEAAGKRDPQAIVIVDYGAGPENTVQAKIEQLRHQPLLAETTAVRENNIIALPYGALVESPRNPQATTTVAEFLRANGY